MFIAIGAGIILSLIALGGLTKAIVASNKRKLLVGAAYECWGLNASQRD